MLGSYDGNGQIPCNPSIDHFDWDNVEHLGFQRCSESLSGKVAESAGLIVGEQLAVFPDAVVAFECQMVTCPTGLLTNQVPFQLHPLSEPLKSFLTNHHPKDERLPAHKPVSGLRP